MIDILEKTFVFDALSADMFVRTWNSQMEEYGFISLSDVLDNQLLLGQYEGSREINKFMYNFFGWKMKLLSVVSAFDVEKGRRYYHYILKLPEIETLSEESS